MNTDYAKELLAEYEANFIAQEKEEFRGYSGSQRYPYAAGAFYQMCKMLVEEIDQMGAK